MSRYRLNMNGPIVHVLLLAAAIGYLSVVGSRFSHLPFAWRWDFTGAQYAVNAMNHLRYGLGVTKGGQVENCSPGVPEHLKYNTHHPPLMPLTIAASYAVFGPQEASARGVMIFFTAVNILLLYAAVRLLIGKETALIAALLFALLPLNVVYATKVNHEPMVLTFVLACLAAYGNWLRKPGVARLTVLALVFCVGTLVGWGAYYVGGLIPAFHFFGRWYDKKRIDRSDVSLLMLPALAVLMFGVYMAHVYWIDAGAVDSLLKLAAQRGGVQGGYDYASEGFSNLSLVQRTVTRTSLLFTLPAVALGVTAGLLVLGRVGGSRRGEFSEGVWLLLFWAVGLAHIIVFRHVSWIHEFLVYYLMVPISVSAGWLLWLGVKTLPRRTAAVVVVVFAVLFVPLAVLQARDLFWSGHITTIVPLGEYLKKRVPENGFVVSTATRYPLWHPGVCLYSERDMLSSVETVESLEEVRGRWKSSPLFLIALGPPSADQERTAGLVEALDREYAGEKTPWGIFYDLSAPRSSAGGAASGK